MTIQDLGSIGELVGALAVLLTLIYLSLQTRQARLAAQETAKFAQFQASHSAVDVYARWRAHLINNQRITDALEKANLGKDLSWGDTIAISTLFEDLFFSAAYSYKIASSSGSFHDPAGDVAYIASMFDTHSISYTIWKEIRPIVVALDPNFVLAVDKAAQKPAREDNEKALASCS